MRSNLVSSAFFLFIVGILLTGGDRSPVFEVALAGYGQDKVLICHIKVKKGVVTKTTELVAALTVNNHLSHGDTLGPCPVN